MNEQAPVVAVTMPADMGSAVAARLARHGLRTVTNLQHRSARTRQLAEAAGVEDLGDDVALVEQSDIILSIVEPSAAPALAERIAGSIALNRKPVVYVDCNAIAPDTTRAIAAMIEQAGGRFADAGIIGPPPRTDRARTIFYASGPAANEMAKLADYGLNIRRIGERSGDASAVKMCYASLTKGTAALMVQLLVTADRLAVGEILFEEFAASQAEQLERMRQWVPGSVPKSFRWIAEMQEIAATFRSAGVTGKGFDGAARTFEAIAATEVGRMKVEAWADAGLSFEEIVRLLAAKLPRQPAE